VSQPPSGPRSANEAKLDGLRSGVPTPSLPPPSNATPAPDNQSKLAGLSAPPVPPAVPPYPPTPPTYAGATPPSNGGGNRRIPTWLPWTAGGLVALAAVAVWALAGRSVSDAPTLSVTQPAATAPAVPSRDAYADPADFEGLVDLVKASTFTVYCGEFSGSAFMLDPSAIGASGMGNVIVTNHHVVETCLNGSELQLVSEESTVSADVLGFDVENDLALLTASIGVPALQASSTPVIGQWVAAVGSPIGVDGTVTFGTITNVRPAESVITTDAAISPGSSGGPLIDNRGLVVGVTYAVLQEDFGSPIGLVRTIEQLCERLLTCTQ